jgi:hypothetical protein
VAEALAAGLERRRRALVGEGKESGGEGVDS